MRWSYNYLWPWSHSLTGEEGNKQQSYQRMLLHKNLRDVITQEIKPQTSITNPLIGDLEQSCLAAVKLFVSPFFFHFSPLFPFPSLIHFLSFYFICFVFISFESILL